MEQHGDGDGDGDGNGEGEVRGFSENTTSAKKPGGENNENKIKKVKLVSKTSMRKKSEHTRSQVENSHGKN